LSAALTGAAKNKKRSRWVNRMRRFMADEGKPATVIATVVPSTANQ
jgi:hypothetical protein